MLHGVRQSALADPGARNLIAWVGREVRVGSGLVDTRAAVRQSDSEKRMVMSGEL